MTTTTYDALLEQFKEDTAKAGEKIPKMYDALRDEGLSPEDARDRIEKDLLPFYSKRWIRQFIPQEAKQPYERKSEVTSNSRSPTELSNPDGTVLLNKQGPEGSEGKGDTGAMEPPTKENIPAHPTASPPITASGAPSTFQQEVTKGIEEKLNIQHGASVNPKQLRDAILDAIRNSMKESHIEMLVLDTAQCPKCRHVCECKINSKGWMVLH